jgi:predicted GTPase
MTELLERAITVVKQLPIETQDAIATRLLDEFADEQAWDGRFESTTDAQWDRMAESVRKSILSGETFTLDEIFPPRTSS